MPGVTIGVAKGNAVTEGYDLERFVTAQAGVYPAALAELRAGEKRSHWMWFVFPQIAGLGRSAMAAAYAIGSIEEARAYLAHPVLGPRYLECVEALLMHRGRSAEAIMGTVDAMKLRSSLTLFAAAGGGALVEDALGTFFGGADAATLERLG
ncbi:DUF1810 domain-containing protein [Sphingomonas yantingensis]|uniref:Uncharacterized protein (DUF1810 family) n=1 Tax=Sphingomonas yantingensis TaxID=1241761 RepID=A0A7W9ASR5_9SPHN|nr:uncharacterized protein (DUF1810 family) [Sphingomonas yantingensis]